ncbi:hypothetical protein ACROYT_G036921 [Oculina patagonica]
MTKSVPKETEIKQNMSTMYIGFAIVFSMMVVVDLVGNTLVILVILQNESMKTPVNYLLVNLAVADILVVYNNEIKSCAHSWSKEIYANVYTVGWMFVAGVMPLGVMGFLYARVVHRLWFTNQESEATQVALLRYRKRVTKLVIAVTIVYALCWVPELTIYFLGFTGAIQLRAIHFNIASALVFFNSTINPVVYALQSSVIRKHLWDLICACCGRSRRSNRVDPALEGSSIATAQRRPHSVSDKRKELETAFQEDII